MVDAGYLMPGARNWMTELDIGYSILVQRNLQCIPYEASLRGCWRSTLVRSKLPSHRRLLHSAIRLFTCSPSHLLHSL